MDRVVFDYSKLHGRIREKIGTQKEFAKSMGLSPATVTAKLSSKSWFDQPEIYRAIDILGIDPMDITTYFFTQKI